MLKHGAEGVRQIEAQVTNTLGWSATTGQVEPWVYRELTQTYVLDPAMRERLAEAQPEGLAQAGQPAASRPRSATTGSPTTRCSKRCGRRAKSSKTDSKDWAHASRA